MSTKSMYAKALALSGHLNGREKQSCISMGVELTTPRAKRARVSCHKQNSVGSRYNTLRFHKMGPLNGNKNSRLQWGILVEGKRETCCNVWGPTFYINAIAKQGGLWRVSFFLSSDDKNTSPLHLFSRKIWHSSHRRMKLVELEKGLRSRDK